MRAGVFSRWNGIMVAAVELTIFLLPFSIVQVCGVAFFCSQGLQWAHSSHSGPSAGMHLELRVASCRLIVCILCTTPTN